MKILNKAFDLRFLDAIEKESENGLLVQNPIFQLYQMAGKLLREKLDFNFKKIPTVIV